VGRPGPDAGPALGNLIVTDEVDVAALRRWIHRFAAEVAEHRDYLTQLDSPIGDADHGANLDRGMTVVLAALEGPAITTTAALFKRVGMTLVSNVGGASGPLYGTFFLRMGTAAGDVTSLDAATLAKVLRAGLDGIVARGKAEAGDKTMFDALAPAVDALDAELAEGRPLGEALKAAAVAAATGRDATTGMLARKGRASYLGERSIGHQDPGATSMALLVTAAVPTLGGDPARPEPGKD
jgi:phosphoenolpyruvate---glycerone phosphotransferase subunit DhaL